MRSRRTTKTPKRRTGVSAQEKAEVRAIIDRALPHCLLRGHAWESYDRQSPIAGKSLEEVRDGALLPLTKRYDSHELSVLVSNGLSLGYYYQVVTATEWRAPFMQRYLRYMNYEMATLLMRLGMYCEAAGISATGLIEFDVKWQGHSRIYPDPKEALRWFMTCFDIEEVMHQFTDTLVRLERKHDVAALTGAAAQREDNNADRPAAGHSNISRRKRAPAEMGWIYLTDALTKYSLNRSSLSRWVGRELTRFRVVDPDSHQVRVVEKELVSLLSRKGLLKS